MSRKKKYTPNKAPLVQIAPPSVGTRRVAKLPLKLSAEQPRNNQPYFTTSTGRTASFTGMSRVGSVSSYADISMGSAGTPYSPQMSPDMLQLPTSIDQQRFYYRHFYDNDPFVHQAINLLTELPLSKTKLKKPFAKNPKLATAALQFCQAWVDRIGLLHRLIEMFHDVNLLGEAFPFAEDDTPEMPEDVTHEIIGVLDSETGEISEKKSRRADADAREVQWLKKNYKGWSNIQVLPPESTKIDSYQFTKKVRISLKADEKTKHLIDAALAGDPEAAEIVATMPQDIVKHLVAGDDIPLNTDPMAGSFVYHMVFKKPSYQQQGRSILHSCLRTLVQLDKLRQLQSMIADRHMTPIQLVWTEDCSEDQLEMLKQQVDAALAEPSFTIVSNKQVNWEEIGSTDRLPDFQAHYERGDKLLYAGFGVTESLLTGEASYGGDRINLEVINSRFLLRQEILQEYVDNYLLKPMCARMGFVEEDDFGNEVVIFPRLSFTRLALRDNQESFDALYNLYVKGSLDSRTLYEFLNLDGDIIEERLKAEIGTVSDSTFNEVLRAAYSGAGQAIVDESDLKQKLAEALGVKYKKPAEPGRFS